MTENLTTKARTALLLLAGDGIHEMTWQMSDSLRKRGFIEYDRHQGEWRVTSKGLDALGGTTPAIIMGVTA